MPGNGIITYHDGYPNMIARVAAWNQVTGANGTYTSGFLSDTVSFDRLTLNLGVRWDRQAGSVLSYSQAGHSAMPDLLPDLTGEAVDDAIVWNSISPRIGLSYALTEDRGTILRASYATFASQMNAGEASFFSSAGSFRGVYFYGVTDTNGNQTVDVAELAGRTCNNALVASGDCNYYGFDINNPGRVGTPNHNIHDYSTPTTHEVIFGMDHELMPNFGVSGNVTWRRFVNFNWRHVEGLDGNDYRQLGTFSGSYDQTGSFSVPYYGAIPANIPADRSRTEYTTRPDSSQRFLGFERDTAARLSFLMSMPITGGAALYKGADLAVDGLPPGTAPAFFWGIVASGVTGLAAVWLVLRVVRTRSFLPFVVYRVAAGLAVLALLASPLR